MSIVVMDESVHNRFRMRSALDEAGFHDVMMLDSPRDLTRLMTGTMSGTSEGSALRIHTLGRFLVSKDNESLLESKNGSNKAWTLFKFLLCHRNKAVADDVLVETFWPGYDVERAKQALYTCIHRLRNALEPARSRYQDCRYISTRDGLYQLNPNAEIWVDAEEFQYLCQQASALRGREDNNAAELYRRAFPLYQGEFLAENAYDDWAKPMQLHYANVYREAVMAFSEWLNENRHWDEARSLIEQALSFEPFEESLHVRYLETLIASGSSHKARTHYRKSSALLYDEYGVEPSAEMKNVFSRVEPQTEPAPVVDFESIQNELNQRDAVPGAFSCDLNTFRLLCRLEQRRLDRSEFGVVMVSLTLGRADSQPLDQDADTAASVLSDVLRQTLRQGDVFCHANREQFFVLLTKLELKYVENVLQRVSDQFRRSRVPKGTTLRIRYKMLRRRSGLEGLEGTQ